MTMFLIRTRALFGSFNQLTVIRTSPDTVGVNGPVLKSVHPLVLPEEKYSVNIRVLLGNVEIEIWRKLAWLRTLDMRY